MGTGRGGFSERGDLFIWVLMTGLINWSVAYSNCLPVYPSPLPDISFGPSDKKLSCRLDRVDSLFSCLISKASLNRPPVVQNTT